ncbi:type I polyketide synthase [Geminocystis sp. NIES-3709]|uniref:hybrid fatty acyl-AMP ligase/type I polyketide synthase n=1 Tax=Geminocystis sp. NIES-3709 TaxID=1617448 RepID=UPI0005FC94B2|nr:type I polyketide synthase [Geminocystis sp. NIES-3709]BAQ66805.1 malonyl CoA-acyl carrier protein transacylase [Geminocystis sp. NIES-3709]
MGYVKHSNFVNLLQERAVSQPDKVIFTFLGDGEAETESLTYQQLDNQAKAIAKNLSNVAHSLFGDKGEGQRALLLYQPGLEFITAFLGCLYAGIIATPAYPPRQNRSFARLDTIIKDAGAVFALTTESLKQKIEQKLTKHSNIICIPTDNIPLDLAKNWQQSPYIQKDNLAFLQYTSGSTGTPKGVMVSHGNLIHNSYLISSCFENDSDSIGCSWLPPYHDMGLIGGILQPIYAAISTIIMPPVSFLQRPIRWLKAISKYKITTTGGPNFAYEMCVNSITEKQKADLDLSSWKLAFSGAEPVRAETIARFSEYFADCGFKREAFYPCYGMAETTLIVSGANKHQLPIVKTLSAEALTQNQIIPVEETNTDSQVLVSSGRVADELESLIVNPDTFTECAENEVGEIWVKGASVAQGYWQKEEATKNIFHAYTKDGKGSFLRTGDLGFISQGELFVTGRLKDLIIIRGRNHYPQDIEESVAFCHEALNSESGAAFAIETTQDEQLVVVFEIKRTFLMKISQDKVLNQEIFTNIRNSIALNHELQVYSIVLLKTGSIPKTSSGKITRYACRQGFLDGTLQVVAEWKTGEEETQLSRNGGGNPENNRREGNQVNNLLFDDNSPVSTINYSLFTIQSWLKENIAQRIGVKPKQIDIYQPFINYGLDSLQAVRLTGELEEWLDCRLSPTLAYDYPNIAQLSQYLVEEKTNMTPTLDNFHHTLGEKIAIVGMACRFPQANNCDEFWQLLQEGKSAIGLRGGTARSSNRVNIDYVGGYIDNYDQFDPQFFDISLREAVNIDPQQRILLQVTHEALENANISLDMLSGSNTGVFIGISSSDYAQLQVKNGWEVNVYTGTGNAGSIASNRISYSYNLLGPSLSVDTACSSSLVAIDLAVNSLKNGECSQAIVGGVNLILSPELTETFEKAGMMAQDGKCKTFSAEADGYVRGEGCGVVILKPLNQAIIDRDNILAVIHGTAVNQDGKSNGLTAPSGKAQQRVVKTAWQKARITGDKINYIEAHGTGTALGDPIELNSLGELLLSRQDEELSPVWIGSTKTNIGHLEAAAGIAGLIKTVLALHHEVIPPLVNFTQLNPYININNSRIKIPTESITWQKSSQPRYAGISSFGFGGTNAHVIIGDAVIDNDTEAIEDVNTRKQEKINEGETLSSLPLSLFPPQLLTISAQSESALSDLVTRYRDFLETAKDEDFANICYTSNIARSSLKYKLAVVGKNKEEILSRLKVKENKTLENSQIAFLCTGQGSQYSKMGEELYQASSYFKNIVDYCEQVLNNYLEKPLTEVLFEEKNESLLNQTIYTQPALFVIEYALAKLWLRYGIQPSIVMGHSVGEYVAATLAGVFSLDDGLKLIAYRGKLMQKLPLDGGMLCLFTSLDNVKNLINQYNNQVEISAINGDNNIVISGYKHLLKEIIISAEKQNIKSSKLAVSHGFHSFLMQPILAEFKEIAETIDYNLPQLPIISNVTGRVNSEEIATADYWVNHVMKPVNFADSIAYLKNNGYQILLEIGAKPTLLGMAKYLLKDGEYIYLPSIKKDYPNQQTLLNSLATLYELGFKINWANFHQDKPLLNKIRLPNYPWQNSRYWLGDDIKKDNSLLTQALYQIEWIEGETFPLISSLPKSYLIFVESYLTEKLAQDLSKQGHNVYLVYQGKEYRQQNNCFWLGNKQEDYQLLWQSLDNLIKYTDSTVNDNISIEPRAFGIEVIIYGWGLSNQEEKETINLRDSNYLGCLPVINLLQSLVMTSSQPQLWLLTNQSQWVTHQEKINPQGGSLWGLGKVIALEHPEYWGGIIDIEMDNLASSSPILQKILLTKNEIDEESLLTKGGLRRGDEKMLAIRGKNIYCPRLRQKQKESLTNNISFQNISCTLRAIGIESSTSYLISGGLGALGIQCANWLIRQGAKNLILLSRRQPSATTRKQLEAWQKQGVNLYLPQVDVTNYEELKTVFEYIKINLPPLKGIIHSAGVLADGILTTLSVDKLEMVMSPKVLGAWNLHRLSLDLPIEFFVNFSSVASLLGSAGQGNYSAGNGYLDSFASFRHSLNLPCLTINWGAFDVGMAESKQHSLTASGMELINVHEGIGLLGELINYPLSQLGVMKINWEKIGKKFPSLFNSPYVKDTLPVDEETLNNLFVELTQADKEEREILLVDYLTKSIELILNPNGHINPDDNLIDLGMDSLMVMEAINNLKTDLQLMLYPREFYERPTISALASYLSQEFAVTHQKAEGKPPLILPKKEDLVLSSYASSVENITYPLEIVNPQPIAFILSSPRSGSTLLRVMLAGHPNLVSPPELHLLPFTTLKERQQQLETSHLDEGLIRTLMDLKGITAEESEALINQWVKENLSIPDLYRILQELSGNCLLVDKSPTYGIEMATLLHAQKMFSNAKYIHLIRHPYSVIESFARLRMDKLLGLSHHGNPYEVGEKIWRKSNENIVDFTSHLESSKVYRVFYEDLVTNPEMIMREMCEFLEVPFSESVLNPYQGKRMTDGVRNTSMAVGDPNFHSRSTIDASLANHWRKINLPLQLNPLSTNLAHDFNYTLPDEKITIEMSEKFIKVGDLNLCVCTWGNPDHPLIVLVHGILDQGYGWDMVARSIAKKGYYIVAPDLRGHGKSDHVAKGCSYNLLDFVADLDSLTNQLTDKPFVLVGHSLGTMITSIFTSMRPQKVSKLVLLEPILPVETTSFQLSNLTSQLDYLVSPPASPIYGDVETVGQRLQTATPDLTADFALKLAQRITKPVENGVTFTYSPLLTTRAGIVNSIQRQQYLQMLSNLTLPLTIIYGDRSNFNREEDLEAQQLAMAQANKIIIKGGHNLHLEKPNDVVSAILSN